MKRLAAAAALACFVMLASACATGGGTTISSRTLCDKHARQARFYLDQQRWAQATGQLMVLKRKCPQHPSLGPLSYRLRKHSPENYDRYLRD